MARHVPFSWEEKLISTNHLKIPLKLKEQDHDRVVAFRRTRDEIREWIEKTFKM
jgi:hypothetical protein